MSHRYQIAYEVPATSKFEAVSKAVQMLRENVSPARVAEAVEIAPGWWKVTLKVSEDS